MGLDQTGYHMKKKTIFSILGFNSTHKKYAIKKTQVITIMKTYPLVKRCKEHNNAMFNLIAFSKINGCLKF